MKSITPSPIIYDLQFPCLQIRNYGLIQCVTFSPTLFTRHLAINNTSCEEFTDITLSRIMSAATDALLTFLRREI